MEKWDGYDCVCNPLNLTLIRGEPIPVGVYHIEVIVIVASNDGEFLLMQRSLDKKEFPGYYEPGASGSVLQGETILEGAFRELEEETGIVAHNMIFIEKSVRIEYKTIYYVYYTIYEGDKNKISLQETETISFKWLSKEEMRKSFDEEWLLLMFKEAMDFVIKKMLV